MGRGLLIVFAVTGLVLAALGVIAHWVRAWDTPALGFVVIGPYLVMGALLAAILLLFVGGRVRIIGLAVAGLIVVAQVVLQLPRFVATTATDGPRVTVMTANLRNGVADPAAIVASVRDERVDVLMLEELTASELARLRAAGLDAALPHYVGDPRPSASGTGLWTRWRIVVGHAYRRLGYSSVNAKLAVPGMPEPIAVLALHVPSSHPSAEFGRWRHDIATVPDMLAKLPHAVPSIVGGDFNATADTVQFRNLLRDGFADAADQAGAGWAPTYPANTWYGPLIAIDHVLTRRAVATSAHTVGVPGSDHRALVATVALRR